MAATIRMLFGNAGWVLIEDDRLPGRLYSQWEPDATGRLGLAEIYLDCRDGLASAPRLRKIPWGEYEAIVNEDGNADHINRHRDAGCATRGMSTLASAFATVFDPAAPDAQADWLTLAYLADLGRAPAAQAVRRRPLRKVDRDEDYRLIAGPADGLTDEFLRDVVRAYRAALARGERPNKALYASLDGRYPKRTVERWVYEARRRGIMPPARKGAQG